MSKRERASLVATIAELNDPVRYVIVAVFSRKFCMYYFPSDGCFMMNAITPACLFKHKAEAQAVAKLLEGRRGKKTPKTITVIAVKKTKSGVRILDEITNPWHPNETWKPILRKKDRTPTG